jgi:hypothetical protein
MDALHNKYILRKKKFIKSFPIKDLDSPNNSYKEYLYFYFNI